MDYERDGGARFTGKPQDEQLVFCMVVILNWLLQSQATYSIPWPGEAPNIAKISKTAMVIDQTVTQCFHDYTIMVKSPLFVFHSN